MRRGPGSSTSSDARRLGVAVTGAALAKDEARITIRGVPDRPGVVHAIFRTIAAANIVVDMIVQNVSTGGTTEVSFTVAKGDLPETLRAAEAAAREIGATEITHDADVAKISVVGLGMRTHTGVATAMFEALADAGVNLQMITTSEIKISVLVDRALGRAGAASGPPRVPARSASRRSAGLAVSIVRAAIRATCHEARPAGRRRHRAGDRARRRPKRRTLGMEDLVIAGVELDESQARIALFHVPDRPGHAASVFRAIAEAGVFVDMIVQNVGAHGDSLLSFTVPRTAAERAVAGRASPPESTTSRSNRPSPSSR